MSNELCTVRALQIMDFLSSTNENNSEIELIALINVLAMGYLNSCDIPLKRPEICKLANRITDAINDYAREFKPAEPKPTYAEQLKAWNARVKGGQTKHERQD